MASEQRLALEERLNDERRNNDNAASALDEIPANDGISNDRVNNDRIKNDRINSDRPGPVLAERRTVDAGESVAETRAVGEPRKSADAEPLFPGKNWKNCAVGGVACRPPLWTSLDEPSSRPIMGLVASAMKRLAEVFAEGRLKLEKQWDRGDNVSTEDLRVALQRYRSFFFGDCCRCRYLDQSEGQALYRPKVSRRAKSSSDNPMAAMLLARIPR